MTVHYRPETRTLTVGPTVEDNPAPDTTGLIPKLDTDPTTEQVPEGRALLFISDGSTGVSGSAGDLMIATHDTNGDLQVEVGVAGLVSASVDGGGLVGTIGGLL